MAKCRFCVCDGHIGLSQIEVTSRMCGKRRAGDRQAAAFVDRYFVRAVDYMRRCHGDSGCVHFHCRTDKEFYKLTEIIFMFAILYSQISINNTQVGIQCTRLMTCDGEFSYISLRIIDDLIGQLLLIFTVV